MKRSVIFETAYETIKENSEWGIECTDKTYGYFIDGIIAMTDALIKELDQTVCDKEC